MHHASTDPQDQQLLWIYGLERIGQSIARKKPEIVRQRLLDHLAVGFRAASGSISLLDESGASLTITAGSGTAANFIGKTVALGEGVLGWVAQEKRPLLLNGAVASDPRFKNQGSRSHGGPASAMCWPLMVENRLTGTISINRGSDQPPFVEEDLRRGDLLVGLAAIVVENIQLHLAQRQRIAELHETTAKLQAQQALLEQMQAQLRASEARLSSILDAAPEAIITLDRQRRIVQFNKGAEKQFGYTAAEAVDRSFDALLPERLAEPWTEFLRSFAPAPETTRDLVDDRGVSMRRRDGAEFPVEVSVSKFTQEGVLYFTAIVREVSERINAEAEQRALIAKLQDAQNQLLQSEKMASIGQLAAGVTHEINNPVGYINSNLATLERYVEELRKVLAVYEVAEGFLSDKGVAARIKELKDKVDLAYLLSDIGNVLKESQEGVTRVRKIVQDLKDFSRMDEAEWQWADLHRGLDSTLNIAHNEIKYKAEVVKEYGTLPPVECLASQVNQVFMNLLVNAAHAIEKHGAITLRTGADADWAWVEVADTGCGIKPEHLKRIFDPFFTTKPVGKGTGLGLSLAYGIVGKHGGRIEVKSEPGRGSAFRVWLPVKQKESKADAPAKAVAANR